MVLETYIRDLMLRYDCVIVPDFGGFITNRISAAIDQKSHTFYPPTKQLGFNHHLTHNDGLLANYIATEENISFEQATHKIVETVIRWNQQVKTNTLLLDKIGAFHLNEKNQLIFNPVITENYLLSSFGLASFEAPTITRKDTKSVPLRSEKTKTRAIRRLSNMPLQQPLPLLSPMLLGPKVRTNKTNKTLQSKKKESIKKFKPPPL